MSLLYCCANVNAVFEKPRLFKPPLTKTKLKKTEYDENGNKNSASTF